MSPTDTIIVWEKRARWFSELQRQFCDVRVLIDAARAWRDVEAKVHVAQVAGRQTLVVIDLAAGVGECLNYLRQRHRLGAVPTIGIATPALGVLEPVLRELGLSSFHLLPLEGQALARSVTRALSSR